MAIIYSYPKVTTPLATDVLVLTDTTLVKGGKRKNQTKSLALSDLASYVISGTSTTTGTGTTNTLPIWSDGPNGVLGDSAISQANVGTGNAKRISVTGARMTITGNGGDADGGTLNLTANSARLGIATSAYPGSITEPEASLDVGKNARVRGSLNVGSTNEQYLFVSTTGDTPVGYVKMGYYGTGVDYNLSSSPQSSTQYTTAFSNGGKICEDERIMTFKLSREVMAGLAGIGKELIAQDSNFTYIVKEAYIYSVPTSGGTSPIISTGQDLQITYQTQNNGIRTTQAWRINSTQFNLDPDKRKLTAFRQSVDTVAVGTQFAVPKSSVRISVNGSISSAGTGICDFFLRMRVKNIDFNDDIKNNTQLITIT